MNRKDPAVDKENSLTLIAGELHPCQRPATLPTKVLTALSLTAALRALDKYGPQAKLIAGGTDIMVELGRGDHGHVEVLVDISRLEGLDYVTLLGQAADELRIGFGPLVTHNQALADPLINSYGLALAQACREIGAPQLRNRATIAGNIATGSSANDTVSALMVHDAVITLSSLSGQRVVPINQFYNDARDTVIRADEMITAIDIQGLGPMWRSLFVKLGLRQAQAISVVHMAVALRFEEPTSGQSVIKMGELPVAEARIAIGSVAPTVMRLAPVEAALTGGKLNDDAIKDASAQLRTCINPIDDLRSPGRYRKALASEMLDRVLNEIANSAWSPNVKVADSAASTAHGWVPNLCHENESIDGLKTSSETAMIEHRLGDPIVSNVNGRSINAAKGTTLLEWLRGLGFSGAKEGCGEGECGACTIHLDGKAVLGCLVPDSRAHGAVITTIEGLAQASPLGLRLQQAFAINGAVQCGYCTPGLVMSAALLLQQHPNPSDGQLKAGLAGNLCRCTGYYKIEQAIREIEPGATDEG